MPPGEKGGLRYHGLMFKCSVFLACVRIDGRVASAMSAMPPAKQSFERKWCGERRTDLRKGFGVVANCDRLEGGQACVHIVQSRKLRPSRLAAFSGMLSIEPKKGVVNGDGLSPGLAGVNGRKASGGGAFIGRGSVQK